MKERLIGIILGMTAVWSIIWTMGHISKVTE